jgi:hypothetical protein
MFIAAPDPPNVRRNPTPIHVSFDRQRAPQFFGAKNSPLAARAALCRLENFFKDVTQDLVSLDRRVGSLRRAVKVL